MDLEKLQRAIESGLFDSGLIAEIQPPSKQEIRDFETKTGITLSEDHKDLLSNFGGADFDEIRINALNQIDKNESHLVSFANDYSGFVFLYDESGGIFLEDTDGGELKNVAYSIEGFINDFFLGYLGKDFYGTDWIENLRTHGVI